MKKIIFSLYIFVMLPVYSYAQDMMISGTVKDAGGVIPGAVVIEKDMSTNGTSTDDNGHFQLTLKGKSSKIQVSLMGYTTKVVDVAGKQDIDVIIQASEHELNEVVAVGYGTVKRITNTGSVSNISAKEIRNVPTANVQNALIGRLPGFVSQQRSGQPGKDAADFYIRGVSSLNTADGNKPLIIVDDIEYDYDQLQQINVNEIESISILKDASTTAVYGIKGANGVLVVKTRRGAAGSPQVNVRLEGGIMTPVKTPQFLNSYETALLVNEALTNDGLAKQFSDEDLEHFKTGDDPYGHPDVNWYDAIFKKYSLQTNDNIDISGGNEFVKYFISGGYLSQNGNMKDFNDPNNQVNVNYFFHRYNFRSNIDMKASKTLNLRLDLTTRFADVNEPCSSNAVSEIYNFEKIHPYSAPFLNPNGSYAYASDTKDKLPTINARLANQGYSRSNRTDFNVLFGAYQDLSSITKGLTASARVAYASVEQYTRKLYRADLPPSYHYDSQTGTYNLDPRGNYVLSTYVVTGNVDTYTSDVTLQTYLNWDRTFGDNHFTVLALYNQQSSSSKSDVPSNFRGITTKISYDYKEKYLVDLNGAYNGTDRFAANHRYGLFPALALGWRVSKESFFQDLFPGVSLLKIRASYGLVGSDVASGDRYLYNQNYYNGGGYSLGESSSTYSSVYEGSLGNANVTWEKAKKKDIGLDLNMFKDRLSLTVDYFDDYRYDQLVTKESVSNILGIGSAPMNVAITTNKGFDGQVNYRMTLGHFDLTTGLVFQHFKNKVIYEDEATPAYPWLAKTGQSIDQPFGYKFIGYYTPEDVAMINSGDKEAPATPVTEVPIQAGDLKYKDLNGDGVINEYDQTAIGKPNLPSTTLGLTLGGRYKNFSINILIQGSFDYSFSVVGTGIETFQSQFQPIHQKRWTVDNADNAEFPRLTSLASTINSPSNYMSDYWLIDALYVRLKTLDLGYQLPSKFLNKDITNVRFFISGYNLLTFTNYDKYQQDPEVASDTNGDSYLNQRSISFGVQLGF